MKHVFATCGWARAGKVLRLFWAATAIMLWAGASAQAATATVSVVFSPVTPKVGVPVEITATITVPDGWNVADGPLDAGNVSFFVEGEDDMVANVAAVGVGGSMTVGTASTTYTFLETGPHVVTVVYNGGTFNSEGVNGLSEPTVDVWADTSTTISFAPNPAPAGEPVTITATVTGPAGVDVTPGLGVTFFAKEESTGNVEELGTVILAASGSLNVATASIVAPFAAIGDYTITAAYNGSGDFVGASSTEATLTVGDPLDSLNLRAMQIVASRQAALNSGKAFTDAIGSAVSDGLNGAASGVTLSAGGIHFSYGPEPASAGLAWPDNTAPAGEWAAWADLSGSGVEDWGENEETEALTGLQLNALAGVSRLITPNVLVGVVGGYENFDFHSDTLDADLSGDGWTIGSYAGGRLMQNLRFHGGVAYSGLGYDGSAGDADGAFDASRWIVTGGLTGDMAVSVFEVEPSVNVFGVWESQDGYTDSLGTVQDARDFSTGRASAGFKVAYPVRSAADMRLAPYAGLYADYTFEDSSDELADVGLSGGELQSLLSQGWSARVVGGVTAEFAGGSRVSVGGEVGGLGDDLQTWKLRTGVDLPF